jgi:hypothetical protein
MRRRGKYGFTSNSCGLFRNVSYYAMLFLPSSLSNPRVRPAPILLHAPMRLLSSIVTYTLSPGAEIIKSVNSSSRP